MNPLPEQNNVEVWKQVAEWPYEISSLGRITRINEDGTRRELKTHVNKKTGHRFVVMHRNGVAGTKTLRSLVAAAFLPEPLPSERLQFRDNDKNNCEARNLYWKNVGLVIQESYRRAGRHPSSTALTAEIYGQVKELWKTGMFSQVQIGKMLGIHNSTVSKIVHDKCVPRASLGTFKNVVEARPEVIEQGLREAEILAKHPYHKGARAGPLGRGIARAAQIFADDPTISIKGLARAMGVAYWSARDYLNRLRLNHQEQNAIQHQECSGDSPPTMPPGDGTEGEPLGPTPNSTDL